MEYSHRSAQRPGTPSLGAPLPPLLFPLLLAWALPWGGAEAAPERSMGEAAPLKTPTEISGVAAPSIAPIPSPDPRPITPPRPAVLEAPSGRASGTATIIPPAAPRTPRDGREGSGYAETKATLPSPTGEASVSANVTQVTRPERPATPLPPTLPEVGADAAAPASAGANRIAAEAKSSLESCRGLIRAEQLTPEQRRDQAGECYRSALERLFENRPNAFGSGE